MRVVESINSGLHRAFEQNQNTILIGEDILDPYGGAFKAAKGLSTRYPDRVLTTPVSEAGIMGVGAGLAIRGFRPIVEIMFGDFILLAADQIINHVAKYSWVYQEQVTVPMVIRTPMGGRRGYGPTHSQSLEKHILGTPQLRVLALSHVHDPGSILEHLILHTSGPALVIENKTIYSQKLLLSDPGLWNVIQLGDNYPTTLLSLGGFEEADITVITYGGSTSVVMRAAEELMIEDEIAVEIVNVLTLQPLSIAPLTESVKRSGLILIVEEGTESYGFASETSHLISNVFFDSLKLPPQRIGAFDMPIGNAPSLEDAILPSSEKIKAKIKTMLSHTTYV